MKVHHLDCGTMRPLGGPLVCHVLLLETADGLVLVDTGFGLADIAEPRRRLGLSRVLIRPVLVAEQTAIRQVEARGFDPRDVRHIVLTHGEVDHAGGLGDFPWARVHLSAAEARAVLSRPTPRERWRYRPSQWRHGPDLVAHPPGGQTWRGFTGVTALEEVTDGVLLVPLKGHTRGHAAVAVDTGAGWVLHAGDAFFHPGVLDGDGRSRLPLRWYEAAIAHDRPALRAGWQRLGELMDDGEDTVVVNSHDPGILAACR